MIEPIREVRPLAINPSGFVVMKANNAPFISDALALLAIADSPVVDAQRARNLYRQARRILEICPPSIDWRERVRIKNLINYCDECLD